VFCTIQGVLFRRHYQLLAYFCPPPPSFPQAHRKLHINIWGCDYSTLLNVLAWWILITWPGGKGGCLCMVSPPPSTS